MNICNGLLARLKRLYFCTLGHPLRGIAELEGARSFKEDWRYGQQALSNQAIAHSLLFAVQYVTHSGVEGDIAEFGCMTGRTAQVIAASLQMVGASKHLHLFDSFEGLPCVTAVTDMENIHVQSGAWGAGSCLGISPGELRKRCSRFLPDSNIAIYAGWFSKTLAHFTPPRRLAMVHIDCDLYQSTIEVLDHLFGHQMISEGAVILFDDWNCNRASQLHGERLAWKEIAARYAVESSDWGGYAWAGHKVIVHSYAR
jgi:hypothetical protein